NARARTVKVKVPSQVQPVLPSGPAGMPFVPVEFTGLTVTPYVNQAGRLAYSLKAGGVRAPGRPARGDADVKEAAA
ncbi:MAG TPA: plasmid replication, integration and excision activator, partial [Streptosporangiaceae bacterium]